MLQDITLYEFDTLNDDEKYQAITEYAALVGDRFECNYSILLYQFDNFYVELFYDSYNVAIQRFRSFITDELLSPYLKKIDLNELI